MSYSKSIAIVLTTVVCATAFAVDAGAQSRGRSAGRAPSGGTTVGRAAPRVVSPGVGSRVVGGAPLRSYYYPYYYGFRPGLSIGLGFGYPYYYGAYGYPYYGAYGYGYPYSSYGYGYGGYDPGAYAAPGYAAPGYAAPGYAVRSGGGYGGVRIQGAPKDAQVYVDGYYSGIVDDYNGPYQRLDLPAGAHAIEIRTPGGPMAFDVNVTPGQTLTIHGNVR
ncbi:MAG TPA: PEGA domain-containing protein [Vicinamibacterales bacterium]|nr:PEGA domain-containing protein [Vicinamibacterales bacterium]